jgi:hypothetical protein
MKDFVTVKVSRKTRKALRELSALTGIKMWAALEQAIAVKLAQAKETAPPQR